MTQGGAGRVPSGPAAQQAAPRSPDYGFANPTRTGDPSGWVPGSAASAGYGTTSADAPTGALPVVPDGGAASSVAPAAPTSTGAATAAHNAGTAQSGSTKSGSTNTGSTNTGSTKSGTKAARAARDRGPRRARLQLRHINPWTVLKFSCVLSVALFFVWLIVVGVLFGILDGAGIIGKINDTVTTIQGGDAQAPVTAGVVFGGAAIIGVVNVVLFIALSTVGSLVYNLCADLVGGIEITLSER